MLAPGQFSRPDLYLTLAGQPDMAGRGSVIGTNSKSWFSVVSVFDRVRFTKGTRNRTMRVVSPLCSMTR